MGSSLRDQLLKAGLADKNRARELDRERKQKSKQDWQARRSGKKPTPGEQDAAARVAEEERRLHAERSRELNRAREEKRAQRALRAEVKQILDAESIPYGQGDIRYHFSEKRKIRRLYVNRKQQQALAAGQLAIVTWEGRHFLIPVETAEGIRQKAPDTFVHVAEPEPPPDPDDPYAAYPVPDDLEW